MPTVDIAAGYRAALVVCVFDDGQRQAFGFAAGGGPEALKAFHGVPAVVSPFFDKVNFLAIALANVAGP